MSLYESIQQRVENLRINDYSPKQLICTIGFYTLLSEELYKYFRIQNVPLFFFENMQITVTLGDITGFYCEQDIFVAFSRLIELPIYTLDEIKKGYRC